MAAGTAAPPALELRLERERIQVRLAGAPIAVRAGDDRTVAGIAVAEAVLDVPGGAPLDASGGPAQFRSARCDLERLALTVDAGAAAALAGGLAAPGLSALRAALRAGFAEVAGLLAGGVPFTAKVAPLAGDAALRLAVYEPRLYAASSVPAPAIASRLAAALAAALPGGTAAGAIASIAPVRAALLAALPRHGWKLPRTGGVRAVRVEVAPAGASAVFSRWDPPETAIVDPDLRAFVHAAPAFARAEQLLGEGELDGARDAWRALPPGARAHPFAAARTLGFLAADPRGHAEARALARAVLERDEAFAPALAAEAVLALGRGDLAAAAHAFAALARAAAARGEAFSALAAADACAACGDAADPAELAGTLDAALALDRSHVPALRAQRDLGLRGGDRARVLRACRGLAAHAPSAEERAEAHLRLAELLAVTDPAAARLHREHARRGGAPG